MRRYAGLKLNDIANGTGVSVSIYLQGCPHKCKGCHNPETWDKNGGMEYTDKVLEKILSSINRNGVKRNFCVLGGEPLVDYNLDLTYEIVSTVKANFFNTKIYLWTGYTLEEIVNNEKVMRVLEYVDVLIDGRFEESKKDLNLKFAGSTNHRVLDLKYFFEKNEIKILT